MLLFNKFSLLILLVPLLLITEMQNGVKAEGDEEGEGPEVGEADGEPAGEEADGEAAEGDAEGENAEAAEGDAEGNEGNAEGEEGAQDAAQNDAQEESGNESEDEHGESEDDEHEGGETNLAAKPGKRNSASITDSHFKSLESDSHERHGKLPSCKDILDEHCHAHKDDCIDVHKYKYMYHKCKKTCNRCKRGEIIDVGDTCKDEKEDCHRRKDLFAWQCPKTCGYTKKTRPKKPRGH
ncbi:sodium/potassium/calcium exchanger 1 [Ditylenchus destructor]|nr:sodium/potassium/calcium exchanger 1 [Ditylenchus destructor]